jgi:uncharacterized secreted repeat protein (TIGR03808 family)
MTEAASRGAALTLPPGRYRVGGLVLPPGARLAGHGPGTVLVQAGADPVIAAGGGPASIRDLAVEGGPAGAPDRPLVALSGVARLEIVGATLSGARGAALRLERCAGRVEGCTILGGDVGLHSLDAAGLLVARNVVEGCANNGIQVWRSAKGHDGTQVLANRISRIAAKSGGSGQNGNGINVYRAGGVMVADNAIRDCAFSAVRNNAGDNGQITGNHCTNLGEVAIFVEFGFEGCVVQGNLVDRAAVGVSMTNFNEGGRLAAASGNVLRNLFRRPDSITGVVGMGIGIAVEADAAVTGNVIEGAEFAGIAAGYGPYLRDVLIGTNVVRGAEVGVAVSTAPRAGGAQIAGNLFSGCRRGAVLAYEWDKAVSGDLAGPGAANRFASLAISGNLVR